jgi:hypothetical protein
MKELPYFRFYSSEWLEGDITLKNFTTQGLFINICAWYWKRDGNITISFINDRFIKGKPNIANSLKSLISSGIIKLTENDCFTIDFLEEQYSVLKRERNSRVKGGLNRWLSSAQAQHKLSISSAIGINIKDKDKYKDVLKSESEHLNLLMITFKIDQQNLNALIDKFDLMNSSHTDYLDYRDHFSAFLNKQQIPTNHQPKPTEEVFDPAYEYMLGRDAVLDGTFERQAKTIPKIKWELIKGSQYIRRLKQ